MTCALAEWLSKRMDRVSGRKGAKYSSSVKGIYSDERGGGGGGGKRVLVRWVFCGFSRNEMT